LAVAAFKSALSRKPKSSSARADRRQLESGPQYRLRRLGQRRDGLGKHEHGGISEQATGFEEVELPQRLLHRVTEGGEPLLGGLDRRREQRLQAFRHLARIGLQACEVGIVDDRRQGGARKRAEHDNSIGGILARAVHEAREELHAVVRTVLPVVEDVLPVNVLGPEIGAELLFRHQV
jgi:hypothetical protein